MMGAAMQLVMPFAPLTSYHAADFIPGASNMAALSLIERWPDWPYSLVLLHGPKGSGKTHLAHVFAERAGAQFIDPERVGDATADQLLTGGHSWVIDGLERVKTEPGLAQLINHARARGDYLVMTASGPAPELAFALPDLRSRLAALPSIGLAAPDDVLLAGVTAKAFSDRQLRIAPELIDYALARMERSHDAVQQFVGKIDALSLSRGRAITPALVREALGEER